MDLPGATRCSFDTTEFHVQWQLHIHSPFKRNMSACCVLFSFHLSIMVELFASQGPSNQNILEQKSLRTATAFFGLLLCYVCSFVLILWLCIGASVVVFLFSSCHGLLVFFFFFFFFSLSIYIFVLFSFSWSCLSALFLHVSLTACGASFHNNFWYAVVCFLSRFSFVHTRNKQGFWQFFSFFNIFSFSFLQTFTGPGLSFLFLFSSLFCFCQHPTCSGCDCLCSSFPFSQFVFSIRIVSGRISEQEN